MDKEQIFDALYSISMIGIMAVLLVTLALTYTSKTISNSNFFIVYIALGSISLIMCIGATASHFYKILKNQDKKNDELLRSGFFLSDSNKNQRIFSSWPSRLSIMLILSVLAILIVSVAGSFLPAPNPYSGEPISKSILDEHSFLINAWSIALIPGFFEEATVFLFISLFAMLLRLAISILFNNKDLRTSTVTTVLTLIVSIFTGSLLFAFSHSSAYGNNPSAYLSAFFFEFTVQSANQLTGLFISWLPHVLHNLVVITKEQLSFSIGASPLFLLIPKRWFD